MTDYGLLLDPRFGVVTHLERREHPPELPPALVSFTARVCDSRWLGPWQGDRVSLGTAWKADNPGTLIFRRTARNFNPAVIMAGKISVVEVEEIVETGTFDPDSIHLPGIYVHRLVLNATPEKRIEKRTTKENPKGI